MFLFFFYQKPQGKNVWQSLDLPTALRDVFDGASIQMSFGKKGCLSPHDFQWMVESRLTLSKWLELTQD